MQCLNLVDYEDSRAIINLNSMIVDKMIIKLDKSNVAQWDICGIWASKITFLC